MKRVRSENFLYDIPELEDSEFSLRISPCPQIEDLNDIGEIGDSFSIGFSSLDSVGDYDLPDSGFAA